MARKTRIPEPGAAASEFCLPDQDGREVCLADFRGKWVVLYFYPKDNTPGCTKEACAFTEKLAEFRGLDAVVLGVSTDSSASHRKFADKHHLDFPLLSDPDHRVVELYGAWGPRKFLGREFIGTARSTFLVDPMGVIVHTWPAVKVWGHADEVRSKLAALRG